MVKPKNGEEGWRVLQKQLGPELGQHLAFARDYLGDETFIRLAAEFTAGEVIVACGINSAAAQVGLALAPGKSKRDQQLQHAILVARLERKEEG